jgi:hypothetical protein
MSGGWNGAAAAAVGDEDEDDAGLGADCGDARAADSDAQRVQRWMMRGERPRPNVTAQRGVGGDVVAAADDVDAVGIAVDAADAGVDAGAGGDFRLSRQQTTRARRTSAEEIRWPNGIASTTAAAAGAAEANARHRAMGISPNPADLETKQATEIHTNNIRYKWIRVEPHREQRARRQTECADRQMNQTEAEMTQTNDCVHLKYVY